MKNGLIIISRLMAVVLIIVGIALNIVVYVQHDLQKPDTITYLTYKDLSTSIDENNRLHLLIYAENNRTIILSDTVALGIHAQISNIVYKDYLEKTKK